jgi:hypothetical protein
VVHTNSELLFVFHVQCMHYAVSSTKIHICCFPIYSESEYQHGLSVEESDATGGFAIVINGHSLVHALHPQMEKLFLEVSSQCEYSHSWYSRNNSLFLFVVVSMIKKLYSQRNECGGASLKGYYCRLAWHLINVYDSCFGEKCLIWSSAYLYGLLSFWTLVVRWCGKEAPA